MSTVAKIFSAAPIGFTGHLIEVESDTTRGLPSLQIVGLGNKAIDEAKERVKSAISNSLLEFPARHITINLAPAELPKDGAHYDLPIALAILTSSGQLQPADTAGAAFAGELALTGDLRPIKGAIMIAETAKQAGLTALYLPVANAPQAQLVADINIIGVRSLKELYLHLKKEALITPPVAATPTASATPAPELPTLDDIHGQAAAKRALIIAAAGHHNILLTGPPGTGKTMLARALTGLLPPLTPEEQIAVTKLHSLTGNSLGEVITKRPFQTPHHTASAVAMIGGGTHPRPGEVSLAHLGVLFLDEIPEYPRGVLESLRQPLEDRTITVSRASTHITYPANFMLVATMNPCPCGFYGDTTRECSCAMGQILAYQKRLSGPLLDRIDLVVPVSRVPNSTLLDGSLMSKEQHKNALSIIKIATDAQRSRYKSSMKNNSGLTNRDITSKLTLTPDVRKLLSTATDKLNLSARSYFKIIRVARTIADLESHSEITIAHISEALQYRQNT